MRERLVGAFIGLTVLVVALYGVPRAYFLGDLVRSQAQSQTDRSADLIAVALDERIAARAPITSDYLTGLSAEGQLVTVSTNGLVIRSVIDWTPRSDDLRATATLTDGGSVTVVSSSKAVSAEVADALNPLIVLGLLLALLAGFAGFVMARRLARPFQELAQAAQGLGTGQFHPRLPTYRVPEARAIGTAITMTGRQLDSLLKRERAVAVHASHELRTPVTALRLELEDLALWAETPPTVAAELRRCVSELDRLTNAIGGLLSLAQERRLQAEIDLDLDALVADTVARLERDGRGPITHLPAGPIPAHLEPRTVMQILESLTDGARQTGEPAQVRARDAGTHLEVQVSPAPGVVDEAAWDAVNELATSTGGRLTRTDTTVTLRLPRADPNDSPQPRVPTPSAAPGLAAPVATTLDTERDRAIEDYQALSEPGRDLQALVELAALVCDVPNSAINLITSDHQHQVATTGFDPSVCAREDSMCAAVLGDTRVVVSPDASKDDRFRDNPFVTGAIGDVRFYASAPLTTPAGVTIGRLCAFDDQPHEFADERAEILRTVADRIVDVLELRLRSQQLEESLAKLNQARDDLGRSNELLSVFAGQVSHDLRSPLTAILATSELLATEPAILEDPSLLELVTATTAAGQRMGRLIDSVLGYAGVGATLHRADVPLTDVLDEVLADLAPVISERGAVVERSTLPTVHADPDHLYTVLLNLVSNAVKFTPVGTTPQISVASAEETTQWRITVTDNGAGIAAADRDAVFALHVRGNGSVAGSGIGLATARRAVEAHGGQIGITDGVAGGTTVWFTLPR